MDIKTTTEGDLDLTNGLDVASAASRDRHMILVRSMTIRGEVPPLPELGVSDALIGQPINAENLRQIEQDVLEALLSDFGLEDAKPIVRAVPTGPDKVAVIIQVDKEYGDDNLGKLVVVGDYWYRDEAITLLDGSEG